MGSNFFRNKGLIAVASVIALFIFIAFALISLTQKENPKENTANGLCAPFTNKNGEISCEEAKNTALVKYPGQVLSINKAIRPYPSKKSLETERKKLWIIRIKPSDLSSFKDLNKPTDAISAVEAVIDPNTKKILFTELYFKK